MSGIELDSEAAAGVREQVAGAVYEWRSHEISIRVDDDPATDVSDETAGR